MSKLKSIVYSTSVLVGTIVGVGIFSLPYITSVVGIWTMLGYFLVLGVLVILIHLFFAELALKTPDFKRVPGFAEIYFGKSGKFFALFTSILSCLGTILAYIIVGGDFLGNLLSPILGGTSFLYTFLYFAMGALLIFLGTRSVYRFKFFGLSLAILVLIMLFAKGMPFVKIDNLLVMGGKISNIFLPYGPILFSLWGATLIPEAEETLGENKQYLKKIIPISILIPMAIYFLFIFLVLGIYGLQTTESALTGLKGLGGGILSLGLIFGVLTTFNAYIGIGLTLKKILWYDFKINKNLAWLITCFVPFLIFLLGVKNFIPVISFIGAVMLGLDGILILLMYRKIKTGAIRFLTHFLILVLVAGIIYEIVDVLK